MESKRVVIVGGVAGGMSAATRARRLSENAEIIVFEKGEHVSFANCGLPYFVGGEIEEKGDLLVQTPESLYQRFRLDIRARCEVLAIHRDAKEIEARDLRTGAIYRERYDALILSTGAFPLKPPIPGIDRDGHYTVRYVPDAEAIKTWIDEKGARTAVIVGGGYIGLEMADQLRRQGLSVTIAEALPQVTAPLDPEMAAWLQEELKRNGVALYLNDGVASFDEPQEGESAKASVVTLKSGKRLPADLVILSMGVRPETGLAKEAGLEIGAKGGIRVNDRLMTSDPNIWAVGDAIETRNEVTDENALFLLAGPANRQGRIAADNVFGKYSRYEGTLGTAIVKLFETTAASAGANERALRSAGVAFETVHLHPNSHAAYYPGAKPFALKILFSPLDGQLLGAQAVGSDGIDKRIDVLATALKAKMTVFDLAQLELAYAPPFGSAKDPINMAGMIAENLLNGDVETIRWDEIDGLNPDETILLDVRSQEERAADRIPGSLHIPLHELRDRLSELPLDKKIVVYCASGQRSYYAARILMQCGYQAKNLDGALRTWRMANPLVQ